MDENRLVKIETALMHQDRQIQELEDIVTAQRREIDALQKYLERVFTRIGDMEQGGAEGGKGLSVAEQALRDKPPHY